jgi:hypothetical protein
MRGWAIVLVLLSALGACNGTETVTPRATQATAAPPAAAPTTEPSRCEKVSSKLLSVIAKGLTVAGGGSLRNGYAVKSNDFSKVYMVAADIQGDGMEGPNEVGVWATNNLDVGGLIFAVDSFAQEFSDWGHGDTTDANSRRQATALPKQRNAQASRDYRARLG